MKITAPAGTLACALSFASRATARAGSTRPILTSALFEADESSGVLTVSTTDTELTARLQPKTTRIHEGGRTALPARILSDVARSMHRDIEITICADENEAALETSAGTNRYSLRVYPPEDFPGLPRFPEEGGFSLKTQTLADAISRVAPTASTDRTRPVLTGALFSFTREGAAIAATNSFRLTVWEGELDGVPREGRAVIPARALAEVRRLCSAGSEDVEMALTGDHAFFRAGKSGVMLATRLIGEEFPDYRKLLPESFEKEYTVEAGELTAALCRANLFSERGDSPTPVHLCFHGGDGLTGENAGYLSISVVGREIGSASESVGARLTKGEGDFAVSFNPRFLIESLKAAAPPDGGSGELLFRVNEPLKPVVVRPKDGGGVTELIMPMRYPAAEDDDGS